MSPDIYKSHPPKMNLDPIRSVLGEETPQVVNSDGQPTELGRYRLTMALQNKFGDNYKNNPSALSALQHYDSEHKYFKALRKIQGGA